MPHEPMTNAERESLFREMRRSPDPKRSAAREKLIVGNLNLVGLVMRLDPGTRLRWGDDLAAVGRLALVKAVDGYDPDAGFKFSTYAADSIRRETSMWLTRAIAPLTISFPACRELIRHRRGRAGGPQAHQLPDALAAARSAIPIQAYNDRQDGQAFGTVDPCRDRRLSDPSDDSGPSPDAVKVRSVLSTLRDEDRRAITLRFGLDGGGERTLQVVATAMGFKSPCSAHYRIMRGAKTIRAAFPEYHTDAA